MFNEFARHEQAFEDWRRDGYPGVCAGTCKYIDSLSSPEDDRAPREGTLWPSQWEAFLRVIYGYEALQKPRIGKHRLALNVVTGGGKTAINAVQHFAPVPEAVWTYRVGGYQVCEKWLKDRKGRRLDLDDIRTYCRIVTALSRTIEIQGEIDALYPGGERNAVPMTLK